MDISDYIKQLEQGQKDMLNPVLLRERCEVLFPDVDFTLEVEGTTIKTTGLSEEQFEQLQEEMIKLSGL